MHDPRTKGVELRDLYNREDAFALSREYRSLYESRVDANLAFIDVVVTAVPFDGSVRAIIEWRTFGFCKQVVDGNNLRILGCHVVGERRVEFMRLTLC
jgi:pyruvate/2-oxoglutarate dehydrogenase complex dihydrolipoamide dehydrogenase (E3) component